MPSRLDEHKLVHVLDDAAERREQLALPLVYALALEVPPRATRPFLLFEQFEWTADFDNV